MIVIPAIDIKGGKVVRLTQGKAELETAYSNSPVEVAQMWIDAGADLLHVVDLDGAIYGNFRNLPLIKEMAKSITAKIELGGGLRDENKIKEALDAGVEKVVIGTKALDEKFLSGIIKKFGDRIVVGVDAKDGFVYTKGWVAKTQMKALDLVKNMADMDVKTINYTDISRDGMLKGPNIQSLEEILKSGNIDVVVSGGISTLDDVRKIRAIGSKRLKGMIIGKALYEKTIDLREAIKLCAK